MAPGRRVYPAPPDAIVNLEHGYFGAMASPVHAAFEQAVRYTNEQLSPFVRGEFTRARTWTFCASASPR